MVRVRALIPHVYSSFRTMSVPKT